MNPGFNFALAAMVGPSGRVLAYDVQQSRLQQLGKAAERKEAESKKQEAQPAAGKKRKAEGEPTANGI